MAVQAWAKFEESLKKQGYTFDAVKFTEEGSRVSLLAELGITSALEKGAIVTEWKKRLQQTPVVSVSAAEPQKKGVSFEGQAESSPNPSPAGSPSTGRARSGSASGAPRLGDPNMRKLNDLRWMHDSCLQLFKQTADKETQSIGPKELRKVAYNLGVWLDDEALYAAMSLLDTNGDGRITLEEFYTWYRGESRFLKLEEAKLKEVQIAIELFQQYDKNNTGTIQRSDWLKLWRQLFGNEGKSGRMKPEYLISAEQNLVAMDVNKDGVISLDEYISWLQLVGVVPKATSSTTAKK